MDILTKIWWFLWPVGLVIIGEHIILNGIYKKKSSLQRLSTAWSESSKTDFVYFVLYYLPWRSVRSFINWITLPGLSLLALVWFRKYFEWQGLLVDIKIENYIAQLVLWTIILDFGQYAAHVAMHKLPFLWRFHAFHHAVDEMNIIAGNRVSFGEKAINNIFAFGLLIMLVGAPRPDQFFILIIVKRFIDLLQHSDLPWSYGFIGKVIAGPRFHRMHHSSEKFDFDSNYGNIFTFWDHLFGTMSKRYQADSTVADTVKLGLDSKAETTKANRWKHSIFYETIFGYVWTLGKWLMASKVRTKSTRNHTDG